MKALPITIITEVDLNGSTERSACAFEKWFNNYDHGYWSTICRPTGDISLTMLPKGSLSDIPQMITDIQEAAKRILVPMADE